MSHAPHWTWPPARVDRIPKIPWRGGVWRLMADQADTTAQLPSNWTPEAKQAAQALAARWRAALALVAGEDPGIAASLCSALTNAVRDTSGRVRAAWMDGSPLLPKLLAPTNADQVSQIALEALDA